MSKYYFQEKDKYIVPSKHKTLFGEDKILFGNDDYVFLLNSDKGIKKIHIQSEDDSPKDTQESIKNLSNKIYEKDFKDKMTLSDYNDKMEQAVAKTKYLSEFKKFAEEEKKKGTDEEILNKKVEAKMSQNGKRIFYQTLKQMKSELHTK